MKTIVTFIDSQATIWKDLIGDITDPVSKFLESSNLNSLLFIVEERKSEVYYLKFFGLLCMKLFDLLLTYNYDIF